MSTEAILILVSIVTELLFASGAVGAMIKFGTRISVLEALSADRASDFKEIKDKQDTFMQWKGHTESLNQQLAALIPDIHRLAGMSSTLAALTEGVRAIVPRAELEVRFSAVDTRVDALERKQERAEAAP